MEDASQRVAAFGSAFGSAVDFGRTSADYGGYRAGFPMAFFTRLASLGWAQPGERALDVGTGTGTIARGLARLGLKVCGVDRSEAMLATARSITEAESLIVDYKTGRAEVLPYPASAFDLIAAGQCWHWFDRARAAREATRVLGPGGRLVIAHFDWLPLPGNAVEATEALIEAFNPRWTLAGGMGIYPAWLTDLAIAGFGAIETFSFDHAEPYSHEAWRGRIRASAGVGASLGAEAVERFDAALAQILSERFPGEPLSVPHRVWAVSGVRS